MTGEMNIQFFGGEVVIAEAPPLNRESCADPRNLGHPIPYVTEFGLDI